MQPPPAPKPPRDRFARELARHASRTAGEARQTADKALARTRQHSYYGLCPLCGLPASIRTGYCHAHTWAAG